MAVPMRVFIFLSMATAVAGFPIDPEVHMTTWEEIIYWGYPVEIHHVVTEDGYILELHRIPHGKNETGNSTHSRPVAFMQHGLLCSSSNFVDNLPWESAAFVFADAGFDVWLGNIRGNKYSRNHTRLKPWQEKFWEFSFDEMASIDLPAMIDYVLNITGRPSLYYIGHSQGTLIMFAKLSEEDEMFNDKIEAFFALTPIGTVKYIRGLLGYMIRTLHVPYEWMVRIFGSREFWPSTKFREFFAELICGPAVTNPLCGNVLFLIAGPSSNYYNHSRSDVYVAHNPAGTSTQNILHWVQMVLNGKPQMYDYGSKAANIKHYGVDTPPIYDYTKINASIYLFRGTNDWLADPMDIGDFLLPTLPTSSVKEDVVVRDYNHLDFVFSVQAPRDVYNPIIKIIKKDFKEKVHI